MTLEHAVDTLQRLCRQRDAAAVLQEAFAPDAVIGGEGAPGLTRGAGPLRDALAHMLEVTPELSVQIHHLQALTDDCATTWLHWSSPGPEGVIEFRSLTVWQRLDGRWRIVSDMFGMGRFEA